MGIKWSDILRNILICHMCCNTVLTNPPKIDSYIFNSIGKKSSVIKKRFSLSFVCLILKHWDNCSTQGFNKFGKGFAVMNLNIGPVSEK